VAGEPKSEESSQQNPEHAPRETKPAEHGQASRGPMKPNGPHDRGGQGRGPRSGHDQGRGPRRDDRGFRDERGRGQGNRHGNNARPTNDSVLTAGLFASVSDKEVDCRVKGCTKTWTWFAAQQIRSFGQPPPQRMCEEHQRLLADVVDREIPCRNAPACTNHWLWKRGAQFALLERYPDAPLRAPSRLCENCVAEEKDTHDREMPCRVNGCHETWLWTRNAQIHHRAWLRREQQKQAHTDNAAEAKEPLVTEAAAGTGGEAQASGENAEPTKRGRRRRGGRGRRVEEVPQRMCRSCEAKFAACEDLDLVCRVHGCEKTWKWTRVAQLRTWVMSGLGIDQPPPRPKRMCTSCTDFCRSNSDRQMPCAKPDCTNTWLYKTGTQLQRFVAGESVDEYARLCQSCAAAEAAAAKAAAAEAGYPEAKGEPMPCLTTGCTGTWLYFDGMELLPYDDTTAEPPADRICDKCRAERGLEARKPQPVANDAASVPSGEGGDLEHEGELGLSEDELAHENDDELLAETLAQEELGDVSEGQPDEAQTELNNDEVSPASAEDLAPDDAT
jgi:hypothetical protein